VVETPRVSQKALISIQYLIVFSPQAERAGQILSEESGSLTEESTNPTEEGGAQTQKAVN
jgi:hypothetical protein